MSNTLSAQVGDVIRVNDEDYKILDGPAGPELTLADPTDVRYSVSEAGALVMEVYAA
jgi:hypothetical protein